MYKHNNTPALNKIGPNQQEMLAVLSNIVTRFSSFFNRFLSPVIITISSIISLAGACPAVFKNKEKKFHEKTQTDKSGIQSFLPPSNPLLSAD